MSKLEWITCIISAVLLVVAYALYDQCDSERSRRIELEAENRHFQSELFASNRLLFLCESEMQELYNVPGLGSEIDSILGRVEPTDTVYLRGNAVAGSFGDLKRQPIDSSEVTE